MVINKGMVPTKKDDALVHQYTDHFTPNPDAIKAKEERAFEIYYGWSVLPADTRVVVRSVTTTRVEEVAVTP